MKEAKGGLINDFQVSVLAYSLKEGAQGKEQNSGTDL